MPFEILDSFRPEMSSDWISEIEKIIKQLEKSKINSIFSPTDPDLKDRKQLAISYNVLMQAHLRRFLCLIDSMELMWNNERLLPCTMMGRSCMESAAMPMLINTTLEKCINTKDFNRAVHWIASHILLVRTDLQGSGFDDIKLKKIHINDAIKVVEDLVSGYTRAYDLLSEFLHPNSFGVFCSFCSYSSEAGKTTFLDSQAIEGKTIANCISSLISVPVFGRPGVGSKI